MSINPWAVNFAKGHGIQKAGGIEQFSTYKFIFPGNDRCEFHVKTSVNDFMQNIRSDFYREPLYPFFVGVIYNIFGINPIIVKYFQLLLLIAIASFLPSIGYRFSKNNGFISGVISSPVFLYFDSPESAVLLTEALVSFIIFLILWAYIFYIQNKSKFSSVLLGFSFAAGILAKGSLSLIPVLYLIFILFRYAKIKESDYIKHFALIFISIVIIILPWVIFANITNKKEIGSRVLSEMKISSGNTRFSPLGEKQKLDSLLVIKYRFFLVSTQSQRLLLNGHNEYVPELTKDGNYNFPEGGWLPKWRTMKESFYNNDGMNGQSALTRVINFYRHYPQKIAELIIEKIILSYSAFKFLWLIILLYILDFYHNAIKYFSKREKIYRCIRWIFLFMLIPGISGIIMIYPPDRHSTNLIFLITVLLLIPAIIFNLLLKAKTFLSGVPVIIKIIFIDFFLITVIVFGFQRLIMVIDFIIILVSVEYLISFINDKIVYLRKFM